MPAMTLRHLHHLESEKQLQFGYKLCVKAINPSHLERQNVRLILRIFNEYASQALSQLRSKFNILHYHDTCIFTYSVDLYMVKWVNIKTPHKGRQLYNKYQQPVHKFQTHSLESRFGQDRQLAGGKHDASLR